MEYTKASALLILLIGCGGGPSTSDWSEEFRRPLKKAGVHSLETCDVPEEHRASVVWARMKVGNLLLYSSRRPIRYCWSGSLKPMARRFSASIMVDYGEREHRTRGGRAGSAYFGQVDLGPIRAATAASGARKNDTVTLAINGKTVDYVLPF